jgi:PAS domain S-box-containing protein
LVLAIDAPLFTIVEVNEAYLEVTKSNRSDLIGKGIFEAFPHNDADSTTDGVNNLLLSLHSVVQTRKKHKMPIQKYDIPIRGTSKFESKYWDPENIPLFDDDGQLKFIIHCVRDVTDKIKADKQVKEFEYFFNNSNDFSAIANTEGYFEITNDSFNKELGYTYNELTKKPFIDFVHPDDLDETLQAYSKIKSGAAIIHFINRYQKKEGDYIWLDWNASLNPVTGKIYCIARDVTERRKAQEALELINEKLEQRVKERTEEVEKALNRFEYVTKATFDAIWDWNITEDKIYWGDGFEKIFGYNQSTLKNDSAAWKQNIHPDDIERITNSYYNIVKSNNTNWIEEYRYKKNDGQYSYVINKGIVIRENDGRATRIIGAMQDITKKKEEELRLKLLESVITNTNDSILITEAEPFDEPGPKIIYVNEAFTKMTGYTAEEVIGKTPRILQGPKTDREELKKLSTSLRQWQPYEVTLLNYKKNGEEFWIHISINPVSDDKGWFTHWIAIERDVTKQKQEEERLKLLETVITNTNDAVVIKEARPSSEAGRKILYVNESFTRMSGYTPEEIIGKTHKLLQGPNTNTEELKHFYKALDAWQPCEITIINYNKKGKEYWVQLSLNPVTNAKGEYTHWVSIERDVTERKIQEQKLNEASQILSNTLESIQDGFYTLDAHWNVTYWNKEAERLSGKSKEEMIGRNFWELYEGQISEKIHITFCKAKSQNKPIRLEVFSKNLKLWFELNAFPSEIGLTVYFKNITERKQTESKLKKMNRALENHVKELAISNQELEQFAYVASHDLQEPLRMVTSFLTQIEKKYENVLDDKGKKYIFFAVDGAKRMRQIILDLLEFSRVGKNESKLEEVDLNSIIEEIALLYRNQIEEKKAHLLFDSLPTIRTHAAPIKQVFQNLISNALKYSDTNRPPIITISCTETASAWQFKIKDNGIGISKEYFDKIFIIFQRLHPREEYSGTGMGLAITKKIIENARGQIWLESKINLGTTFYFTISKKNKSQKL